MQKGIVQIDWYTKIILTLIAVLLAGILAKPYIVSRPAGAYGEYVEVTNWPSYTNPMTVRVDNWPSYNNPMSVKVTDMPDVKGEVWVTNLVHATFTVVDWKEKEAYEAAMWGNKE